MPGADWLKRHYRESLLRHAAAAATPGLTGITVGRQGDDYSVTGIADSRRGAYTVQG